MPSHTMNATLPVQFLALHSFMYRGKPPADGACPTCPTGLPAPHQVFLHSIMAWEFMLSLKCLPLEGIAVLCAMWAAVALAQSVVPYQHQHGQTGIPKLGIPIMFSGWPFPSASVGCPAPWGAMPDSPLASHSIPHTFPLYALPTSSALTHSGPL